MVEPGVTSGTHASLPGGRYVSQTCGCLLQIDLHGEDPIAEGRRERQRERGGGKACQS